MKEMLESNVFKVVKGVAIACVITLVMLFIYSALLCFTEIGENTIVPVIILITAVSILARK